MGSTVFITKKSAPKDKTSVCRLKLLDVRSTSQSFAYPTKLHFVSIYISIQFSSFISINLFNQNELSFFDRGPRIVTAQKQTVSPLFSSFIIFSTYLRMQRTKRKNFKESVTFFKFDYVKAPASARKSVLL